MKSKYFILSFYTIYLNDGYKLISKHTATMLKIYEIHSTYNILNKKKMYVHLYWDHIQIVIFQVRELKNVIGG